MLIPVKLGRAPVSKMHLAHTGATETPELTRRDLAEVFDVSLNDRDVVVLDAQRGPKCAHQTRKAQTYLLRDLRQSGWRSRSCGLDLG
jgi:hypothetical protein